MDTCIIDEINFMEQFLDWFCFHLKSEKLLETLAPRKRQFP